MRHVQHMVRDLARAQSDAQRAADHGDLYSALLFNREARRLRRRVRRWEA